VESIKDKVCIVGVGYTPQGRIPNRSALSFHVEAARNAILDAGLTPKDMDGILAQPATGDPTVNAWQISQLLGFHPRFGADQSAMGATAGGMVFHAAAALIYGLASYVVCTYGESPLSGGYGAGAYGRGAGDRAAFGWYGANTGYSLAARRGIAKFETGPETWKEIAVNQRKWANLNPRAMMHSKKMTYEDYYNQKFYVEPFRLYDICLVSDSGRAFVMTTAERAKSLRHRPVYVMGVGQYHPAWDPAQADHLAGPIGAVPSGEEAFRMAGVGVKDVDAAEIYDCFTYTVELSLMGYGFLGPGEGKDFFKNGRTAPGGEFPVNTSGGLLSESYQMGFTPLTEGVVQLQGAAGDRQMGPKTNTKEPEIILVSGNGGVLQTHATVILRR